MYLNFSQNHHDRIAILEVKLANLNLIVNKVKMEINEEIENTMAVLQQQMKELILAKQLLENDIFALKNHRVKEVIEVSFSPSVSF